MGLSNLSALEIAGSYPEGILITNAGPAENGKFEGWIYMLNEDGTIHKAMVNSSPIFETAEAAEEYMKNLCEQIKQQVINKRNGTISN